MKLGACALSSSLFLLLGWAFIDVVHADNRFKMQFPCTVVERITKTKDDSQDFEYDCMLDPRDAGGKNGVKVPITESNEQPQGREFNCGGPGCYSGRTQMYLDDSNIVGDANNEGNWITIIEETLGNSVVPVRCMLPPGQTPGFLHPTMTESNERKLFSPVERSALVVRVTAGDRAPTETAAEMSDNIFGTDGDPVNLATQTAACSYGKLTIAPASGDAIIMDGVVDVAIDMPINGEPPLVVANAVTIKLNEVLNGVGLDTIMYDHVMYCLPKGTKGSWLAFAFLNDNLSVYNDEFCGYVSVQMHEIGHNLGLDHSGDASNPYNDRSGYMGLSYAFDDLPEMCYNAPKSWQLGWYDGAKTLELPDITSTGSFTWSGTLVGISDFNNAAATGKYVIIKIEQASSTQNLYVNFNRISGINKNSQQHQDRVLVTAQADTGQSTHLTALTIGQSYVENDFDGNFGKNFAITVDDIDFSSEPWTADVSIAYGANVVGFEYVRVPTNLTMQEKWRIDEPYFQYEDLDFQLDFNVSDLVTENQVDFELYQEVDCATPLQYGDYIEAAGAALYTSLPTGRQSSPYDAKSGAIFLKNTDQRNYYSFGAGTKTFSLGLSLNAEGAEQDSQVYQSSENGAQRVAQAKFCVRFKLLSPDQSIEVNYLETLVYLDLDLTDGFRIDTVNIQPKDLRVKTANQVYQVVGYKCEYVSGDGTDGNSTINRPLTAQEELEGRYQGSLTRVCVKPDADAETDGIKMRSIDSFTFSQGQTNQVAIVNKQVARNGLTSYNPDECTGADECWFESILFASFYAAPGVVFGSGVASMQFGSRRNRNLLDAGDVRGRQDEEDEAGAAEFELDFDVVPFNYYGTSDASYILPSAVWLLSCELLVAVSLFVSA